MGEEGRKGACEYVLGRETCRQAERDLGIGLEPAGGLGADLGKWLAEEQIFKYKNKGVGDVLNIYSWVSGGTFLHNFQRFCFLRVWHGTQLEEKQAPQNEGMLLNVA